MRPLVSAVIPTVDRPELLRRAVDSVEAQTHDRIEVLVVGSPGTPDVSDILADVDLPRAEFLDAGADSPAAARNIGIEHAEGEYVAFLDDDDTWNAAKTERQLDRLAETGAGASLTGVRKVGPGGKFHGASRPTTEGDLTKAILEYRFVFGTLSAMMLKRAVARAVDGFDERFVLLEDGDFYLRVSRATDYCVVPEPLVTKYTGAHDQVTGNVDRRLHDEELFIRKHRSMARQVSPWTERRMIGYLKYDSGRMAANQAQYRLARQCFTSAFKHHPTRLSILLWLCLVSGGPLTFRPARYLKRTVAGWADVARSRR